MNPWDIVTAFEQVVAKYTGSRYAVACDSCTNALLLCLSYSFRGIKKPVVTLPKRTYVGVAQSILNAGGKIYWEDYNWKGSYILRPHPIIDSARCFKRSMCYDIKDDVAILNGEEDKGTRPISTMRYTYFACLSFHWMKALKIGKGGMILTDDKDAAYELRKMRYDGRTEGVHPKDDKFIRGYHCYMSPADAATGLLLMQKPQEEYIDTEPYDYGDLSLQEVFK